MAKLTNEQLEILVEKRNAAGLDHTVEVMTNEELVLYRNNCIEANERRREQMKKYRNGGSYQQMLAELIEQLDGYIAYIDAKLAEEVKPQAIEIIDLFLANWREKAHKFYTEVRAEYKAIEGANKKETILKRNSFLWSLTKSTVQIITYPSFETNLNSTLDFEVDRKKSHLLQTITKKAGNIIETKDLTIGDNGDINGIIIGDRKTVTVKTITAGGHSVQCLHYRVLVK